MKKVLVMCMLVGLVAGAHAELLQDWQFNDSGNPQLNAVLNSGSLGTSFDYGGPRARGGVLQVGDFAYYDYTVSPGGTTYRSADFSATPVTTGQLTFEYAISTWDMAGTNGVAENAGDGIQFRVIGSAGTVNMKFEATSGLDDIRLVSNPNGTGTGGSYTTATGIGLVKGSSDLVFQLNADLDTGLWSTRYDKGAGWVDMTTNGTGMIDVTKIQFTMTAGANGWEQEPLNGDKSEYIGVDYATMDVIPEPATMALLGLGGLLLRRRK